MCGNVRNNCFMSSSVKWLRLRIESTGSGVPLLNWNSNAVTYYLWNLGCLRFFISAMGL